MNKKLIIVKRNSFLFNGKEYSFNDLEEISNLLKSNIKVILLEEELYSKHFHEKVRKIKLKEFVAQKINNEFPDSSDILYNYEQNKTHRTIAIYSSKGGIRIGKISERAKNLEVKPMQYIIQACMQNILDNKLVDSKILIKFNGYYYYVSFQKGLFYYGFVEKEMNIIINRILECEQQGQIYVDDNIEDSSFFKENFKLIKINIGDLLNEQVYTKQKFHSKAIL